MRSWWRKGPRRVKKHLVSKLSWFKSRGVAQRHVGMFFLASPPPPPPPSRSSECLCLSCIVSPSWSQYDITPPCQPPSPSCLQNAVLMEAYPHHCLRTHSTFTLGATPDGHHVGREAALAELCCYCMLTMRCQDSSQSSVCFVLNWGLGWPSRQGRWELHRVLCGGWVNVDFFFFVLCYFILLLVICFKV